MTKQPAHTPHTRSFGDVLILGAGTTGKALAEILLGPRVEARTVTLVAHEIDATWAAAQEGIKIINPAELANHHFDLAIASPGISVFSDLFQAAACQSEEIIGEPEFAWRLSPERWIAVTGTNGKTTTVTLIDEMLRASHIASVAAGNIGRSLAEVVLARDPDSWVVAELSSYQLATIKDLHPEIACLVNIDEDHVAWHKTHEHYVASKARIFENTDAKDMCIVGAWDAESKALAERLEREGKHVCRVDANEPPAAFETAGVEDGWFVWNKGGYKVILANAQKMQLVGAHNVQNALIASVAALSAGASAQAIENVLSSFRGLSHRIEKVEAASELSFYDDSKATNTDAALSAILALRNEHLICLFGGSDKGGSLEDFVARVSSIIDAAICYGEAKMRFADALSQAGVKTLVAPHLKEAFFEAVAYAHPGQTILLSPACASFDEFSSFEERGDAFQNMVKEFA